MTESYSEKILREWLDMGSRQGRTFYSELIGKYLRLPPFGIGGDYIQKATAASEACHQWIGDIGEFLFEFGTPFVASLEMLSNKFDEKTINADNGKALYDRLIEVLDEQYDAYLRSPEGTQRVTALIDRYLDFKARLDEALEPWLKANGVPTHRDMQDIYKGIHELKRKHRLFTAETRKMNALFEMLNARIDALEKARAKTKSVVKSPRQRFEPTIRKKKSTPTKRAKKTVPAPKRR